MRKKNQVFLLLPVVVLLLTSCATTFMPYANVKYTPKSKAYEMPVFESNINRPYRKIGMIETVEYFEMTSALSMLKKYAREAGADAVINVRYVGSGGMAVPVGNMAFWASGVKAVGEAVIFTAPTKKNKTLEEKPNKNGRQSQQKSIEERLIELKRLYEKGLIKEEEYQRKREQILDQM